MTQEVSREGGHPYEPVIVDGAWQNAAACRDADPDSMFPEVSSGPLNLTAEEKEFIGKFCGQCAVRSDCLASSFIYKEQIGIFGGIGERYRKRVLKEYQNGQLTIETVTAVQGLGEQKHLEPSGVEPSVPAPVRQVREPKPRVRAVVSEQSAGKVDGSSISSAGKVVRPPHRRKASGIPRVLKPRVYGQLPPLDEFLTLEEPSSVVSHGFDHTRIDLAAWVHDNFFGTYPMPIMYAPFNRNDKPVPRYLGMLNRKPSLGLERVSAAVTYASHVGFSLSNVYLFPADEDTMTLPFESVLRYNALSIDSLTVRFDIADQETRYYPKVQSRPIVTVPRYFESGFVVGWKKILDICSRDIQTLPGLETQRIALLALEHSSEVA